MKRTALLCSLAPMAAPLQAQVNTAGPAVIAMYIGNKDGLNADTAKLHVILDSYGIANSFTIYEGDHTSRVAFRFQEQVMPFFSQHLIFGQRP